MTERMAQCALAMDDLSYTCSNRDEQRGEGMYDGYSDEIPESTQEDEASESWAGHSVRHSTRDRRQQGYRNR